MLPSECSRLIPVQDFVSVCWWSDNGEEESVRLQHWHFAFSAETLRDHTGTTPLQRPDPATLVLSISNSNLEFFADDTPGQ